MAVALLALFVALGGTGYAAAKISGRNIQNRSIPGTKLKRNTLSGAQIRESGLAKVPAASDADFLAGRPAGAYLLAGTGVAANSLRLGGKDASAFLPAGGTAANSALLGGQPASAFLGAGATAGDADKLDGKDSSDFLAAAGKAVDADKLDGKDAADFVPSGRVQGAGPVVVNMPATLNAVTTTTLAASGPFTLMGTCTNSSDAPVARVGVAGDGEFFLNVGESDSHVSGIVPDFDPPTPQTVAQATSSPGQIQSASHTFSAVANTGDARAMFGSGTAITVVPAGGTKQCVLAGWAFVS